MTAKQMFGRARVETVCVQSVCAFQQVEGLRLNDQVQKTCHGTDRAIATQRFEVAGRCDLKLHRATVAATFMLYG